MGFIVKDIQCSVWFIVKDIQCSVVYINIFCRLFGDMNPEDVVIILSDDDDDDVSINDSVCIVEDIQNHGETSAKTVCRKIKGERTGK